MIAINFRPSYEQSDGQSRKEVGMLMNKGTPDEELVVIGMYSFIGDDNNTYVTMYRADKNGYKPKLTIMKNKSNLIKSLVGWWLSKNFWSILKFSRPLKNLLS